MHVISRVLRLDPRPPAYDSVVDATLDDRAAEHVLDDVEMASWAPVTPAPREAPPLAFVDGVERRDLRVSAEGDGWPIAGVLVSYGAGAICPGDGATLRHLRIEHRVILARGARPPVIQLQAGNTRVEYIPEHNAEDDPESLDRTLKNLRADLEADVVRRLIAEGGGLVLVDGRLPPNTRGTAVGVIKTPHRLPITSGAHIDVLMQLGTGQRSPVFVRQRSARSYYSWFVCLRKPGPLDLGMSGLAMLEMDDSVAKTDAIAMADLTAAVLPAYASTPARDDRAPQNLLPVGQLERELRHRLGDPELLRRLLIAAFAREQPKWEP